MRKTSQDGGDSTSITSGFENEYKKISSGIMKSTRNSLKKRVHSLSHESDDAVIEPLLQKDKEKDKVEISAQSAKYLLSKTKTEQRDKERNVELNSKVSQTLITGPRGKLDHGVGNGVKNTNPQSITTTAEHVNSSSCPNYSNGLVSSATAVPKSLIGKEVKGDKTIGHSMGPLIFTTAKIHADGKTKNLEPVHVTVGSISSITETNKTPGLVNNVKLQDTTVIHDNASKSCVVIAVSTDIKLYNQSTVPPDIVASAKASQPSVSYKTPNTTTTAMNTSPTREKLAKLEAYLAIKEIKEKYAKGSNKTMTPAEVKNSHTGAVIVKGSEDVKGTVQQFKDSSCEPKDSKDTTIKSATASQPSVIYKTPNTTTTAMNTSPTREKLAKPEAYLAMKESKEEHAKGSNKTMTPAEVKNSHTGAVIVKGSEDVKDTVQQLKDSSCEPKDSKDTTIKIEPFVIATKLDDSDNTGRKKDNLAEKGVSHMASKDVVDKKPINNIDSPIAISNKNVTEPTHTLGVIDDKKSLKETSSTSSSSKGLNKVESIKQLQRQKKSTLDDSETDDILKPKHVSASPTPTSTTFNKTLAKAEPLVKRESDSDKANKPNKTSVVVAKDAKDNTKTQKASESNLIQTKITKANVSATVKPTTTVKTSIASVAKPSSSNTAVTRGQPSSNAKAMPQSTISATKSNVKYTEQKIKDLSKDGKPPKA